MSEPAYTTKIEPEAAALEPYSTSSATRQARAEVSIAISLKRIADWLEATDPSLIERALVQHLGYE